MPLPSPGHLALLVVASLLAGALNAVAGGGSFLTFPALVLAGVPPVIANATSTVALLPGTFASAWVYRRDIGATHGQLPMTAFVVVSLIGGAAGSILLLLTPEQLFAAIVPWLLLFGTLVFALGRPLTDALRRHAHVGVPALVVTQALIGIYGGYFGGGIGILMLAMLGLYGMTEIHAMNGVKTVLAGCMNIVAAAIFIVARAVWWREALIMLFAAIAGGWIGPLLARRVAPAHLRLFVVGVGVVMTAWFFARG